MKKSEYTYKRIKKEEVFAIKGFASQDDNKRKHQDYVEQCVEGSFIMAGVKYNYKIQDYNLHLSIGEQPLINTHDELFEGFWLVFNQHFNREEEPYTVLYDKEFYKMYRPIENSKIQILNTSSSKDIKKQEYTKTRIEPTGKHKAERQLLKMLKAQEFKEITKNAIYTALNKRVNKNAVGAVLELYTEEVAEYNAQQKHTYIYLMIDHNTGYHKIGRSKNPKFRERTLQSEKPTIEMIHTFKDNLSKEKELHKRYANKRIRGEWFNLSKVDVEYIKSL